ncbi:MAG: HAD family hydrolase [Chloroflexi bacterium]|nr:HAD family hydrolase [Chloroflexota bacterium]
MIPKAIFFDLDDTIIAFEAVSDAAWLQVCQEFAQQTNRFTAIELLESINTTRAWYWSDPERHRIGRMNLAGARLALVKMALEKLGCNDDSYATEIAEKYSTVRTEMIDFIPGAKATLERLSAANIRLALVTNGTVREQNAKLKRFDLAKFFQVILIEEQLGFGKPDERVFKLGLDKMQLNANQAWMVGDNLEWDVAGAQRVGIYSIWNDYKGKGLPVNSSVKPDRIVNSISEIVL